MKKNTNTHIHEYTKAVRFNEELAKPNQTNHDYTPRPRRRFLGWQCSCGKVKVADFETVDKLA